MLQLGEKHPYKDTQHPVRADGLVSRLPGVEGENLSYLNITTGPSAHFPDESPDFRNRSVVFKPKLVVAMLMETSNVESESRQATTYRISQEIDRETPPRATKHCMLLLDSCCQLVDSRHPLDELFTQ